MAASDSPAARSPAARRRICLAASGGGHVRQLLDLEPVWSEHDYFFVTEDTALGRTLGGKHRTHFLPHFAWGQAKQGAVFRMLSRAVVSFFRSAAIVIHERPQVLISTGAGAVFFTDALFGVLRAIMLGSTRMAWISISANIDQVTDAIFRVPPHYESPVIVSVLVLGGLIALSISVLERRVRGVEVVA